LRTLADTSLTERRDGSGTITFGSQGPNSFLAGSGWPGANRSASPRFDLIDHVKSVYEQIRSAQRKAF